MESTDTSATKLTTRACTEGSDLGKHDKTLKQVLSGRSDANIRFDDLRTLLLALGFTERVGGSHHLFTRSGIDELINLQRDGAKAKPYQVKQVRIIILRYDLGES